MSLSGEYFERLYQRDPDPWKFRSRWYESRKRQLTMASLPDERYGSVFEAGCSIGLVTRLLAERSDHVLAMDISESALIEAGQGISANVQLRQGSVPRDWPSGHFDLVLVSEVGYYLDEEDCQQLATLAATAARDLVAVHWRHHVEDYPLTGDRVHQIVERAASEQGLVRISAHLEADFRLDVWSHDDRSVASRTGLK